VDRRYRSIGLHKRSLATVRWVVNEGTNVRI
jgi:hypothetical protein